MTDSNISPADLAPMWSKDPFYLSTMSMGYTRKAESIYKELEDPQVSMLRAEPDMKGQKIGTGPRREGTRSTRAMPWPTGTTAVTKPTNQNGQVVPTTRRPEATTIQRPQTQQLRMEEGQIALLRLASVIKNAVEL